MPGRKRCNELDGRTWTRYSISVWSDIKKTPAEIELNHPASFPLELARRCIEIFTSGPGELVVDPFAGSGTTLMAASSLGRRGVGLELYPDYVELFNRRFQREDGDQEERKLVTGGQEAGKQDQEAGKQAVGERECELEVGQQEGEEGRERQCEQETYPCLWKPAMILDDARNLQRYFKPGEVDFVLTSPPYWDIMQSRRSADRKQPRPYGESDQDLGRLEGYREYLQQLGQIFEQVRLVLKPGGYCVAVVMDLRKKSRFYPLHLDLTRCLEQAGLSLDDIIIWDRRHEYNRLRPLGYPAVFRVNKVHEYLLIFKKF